MKKHLGVMGILVAGVIGVGLIGVNQLIRHEITQGLQNSLNPSVTLGAIDIRFPRHIIMRQIHIADPYLPSKTLASIESIDLEINLGYFLHRNQAGFLLKKIVVSQPHVYVRHFENDRFNIMNLLKAGPTSDVLFERLPIDIKNGAVTYIDRRGFGLRPLQKDQITKIDQFSGRIWVLKNSATAHANFRMIRGGAGRVQLMATKTNEQFSLSLHSQSAEIGALAQYIANIKEVDLKALRGEVGVRLSDNPFPQKGGLPFKFNVDLDCQQGRLKTAWIAPDIEVKSGRVKVNNQGIVFENVEGRSVDEDFAMNGSIKNFSTLDLSIKNERLAARHVPDFLPFLRSWNLEGLTGFELGLRSAPSGKINMSGKLVGYQGRVLQYQVKAATLAFFREADTVSLNILNLEAYGGKGTGSALIHLSSNGADRVAVDLNLKQVKLQDYFGSHHFQGAGDLAVHLQDHPNNWKGLMKFVGNDARIFGQPLYEASLVLNKTPEKLLFLNGSTLLLGRSPRPVSFSGHLLTNNHFKVSVRSSGLESDNLYFFQTKVGKYHLRYGLEGQFEGDFNEAFKADPLLHLRGTGNLIVDQVIVDGTPEVLSGEGTLLFDRGLNVKIGLQDQHSSLGIVLSATGKGLKQAHLTFENMDLNQLKGLLKTTPIDYSGRASGSLDIAPQDNDLVLKGYRAKGTLRLESGHYGDQRIDYFEGQIDLQDNHLFVKGGQLRTGLSRLRFDTDFQTTQNLKLTLQPSLFRSSDFPQFPASVRLVMTNLSGQVNREKSQWKLDIDGKTDTMIYKNVELPDWQGRIRYQDGHLELKDIKATYKKDECRIDGGVWMAPSKNLEYQLRVNFVLAHLDTMVELAQSIRPLIKGSAQQASGSQRVSTQDFLAYDKLLSSNITSLYSFGKSNVVDVLHDLSLKTADGEIEAPKIEGVLRGQLSLENRQDKNVLGGDLTLENVRYQQTHIKKLQLIADRKASGVDIELKASQLALLDNQFDSVRLAANFNPDTRELFVQDLQSQQGDDHYKEILKGRIRLGPWIANDPEQPNDIDLNLNLERQNINLLSFFNNALLSVHNEGDIKLHLSGSRSDLRLDAKKLELKAFELHFRPGFPIRSALRIEEATAVLQDNVLNLPALTLYWKGEDTNLNENKFVISGTIRSSLNFKDITSLPLTFMLVVQPTQLDLNLRDLYVGKASLELTTLDGTLFIPLTSKARELMRQKVLEEKEEGPLLSTKLSLSDGRFVLVSNRAAMVNKPMIRLNTSVQLGKDMFLAGQNIDAGANNFLNNLYVELEEAPTPVKAKGSLNTIEIEHRFLLKEGKLVFMNQIFQLLEKSKQREVFRDHPELIEDNAVDIKMMPDPQYPTKRKAFPSFNLKAFAQVQKEIPATGNLLASVEDHIFVIYVNGFLNTPKSFSVEHYLLDKGRYKQVGERIEMDKMTAEQFDSISSFLLPALLRPQFYQDLLSKGLGNNKEANGLIKNYSASQIDLWLDQQIKPIEKEVVKATGLYDVRIQHKLGEEIMNAVPVFSTEEIASQTNDNSKLSVQYIKDLFAKQLFVKAKTGITQDPASRALAFRLTDYELMWYINNFMSINYANHNIQNSDSFYGAFSINANFDF